MGKLKKEVRDLDSLRFMMNMLKEVRQRESGINMEINPIMNMYQVRARAMGTTDGILLTFCFKSKPVKLRTPYTCTRCCAKP